MGVNSAEAGHCSYQALLAAIEMVKQGQADAITTAPISKQAWDMAGIQERGHTGVLAHHLGIGPTAMAFAAPGLHVALATVHIPLKSLWEHLSTTRVIEVGRLLHHSLQGLLGEPTPRLALAGLNPHAGEHGLLGHEEEDILLPAVQQLRSEKINISAPISPDAVFRLAHRGDYDGVVALYHDQGLIPVKMIAFGGAVNHTLGLRVPRTSPDHGTAFDIAGSNSADPTGMLSALRLAFKLANVKE